MRDPFDSSPALRLGDAKPREALREPRPPSLAPEFGDAFGKAFSKPSRETLAALLGNVAHETRRPVGDGAMRYEPRGFVEIRLEVISEAEFKRRGDREPQIDHSDTSAASLVANHETLVRKAPN